MPIYEVTIPNKGTFEVESDKELTSQQAYQYALAQSDTGALATAREAVSNLPRSTANLFGGLVEAISSPIQTGRAVLDVAAGGLQALLPESVVQAIGPDESSRAAASQVADFYRQRYGSAESVRQTIAKDPAGFLADVSTVLSAGSLAAPRFGKIATAIDPISASLRAGGTVAKGAGKLATETLGLTTGVGAEPIRQAARAGATGGERARQFRENISGRADIAEVLNAAKQNLADMNQAKQAEYRSGMVNIKNDKSVLDFTGIYDAVNKNLGNYTYKGVVKNQEAVDRLSNVNKIIDEWESLNPSEYHTPEGMDALKQRVGSELEKIPFDQKQARAAVQDVYNSIKREIVKQAPTYANVMRKYSTASEQVKEIERALSLGNKASVDTGLRKLQSLMRNNVQTNYGQRLNLARQLEQGGGREIMPALAGQALSEITPRGLSRIGSPLTATGLFSVGGFLPAATSLAASSPRLVGEAAYGAGMATRPARAIAERLPFTYDPRLTNLATQLGLLQERTE
jgi:hypothetical protein